MVTRVVHPSRLDPIEAAVSMRCARSNLPSDEVTNDSLTAQLAGEIKDCGSVSAELRVQAPGSVPRSKGRPCRWWFFEASGPLGK